MRIGVLNNKGGVGKTLVALLLAERQAARRKRVLVVDLDPQANATRRLGVKPEEHGTLTSCLALGVRNGGAAGYIHPCTWLHPDVAGRIDVLPADIDLEDRSIEAGQPGAHNRLRKALHGVDDEYDLTLIDFPPSLKGHLTAMGIAALDYAAGGDTIVVPTEPERDSIAGALRVVRYVRDFRDDLGVDVDAAGLIVNRARTGTNLHDDRIGQLGDTFDVPTLGQPIPLRARVAVLQDAGAPLCGDPDPGVKQVCETGDTILDALLARTTPMPMPIAREAAR